MMMLFLRKSRMMTRMKHALRRPIRNLSSYENGHRKSLCCPLFSFFVCLGTNDQRRLFPISSILTFAPMIFPRLLCSRGRSLSEYLSFSSLLVTTSVVCTLIASHSHE